VELLGTIRALYVYPIKSMGGQSLPSAHLGWHGLDGDRRYAFRRLADGSGFPWLQASRLPVLVRFSPVTDSSQEPGRPPRLLTPEGEELAGDGPELRDRISAACGEQVELLHLNRGIHDEAPLSVISLATMRHLSEAAGVTVDVRRFRPNLVVETPGGQPFDEDRWVGRSLSCGGQATSPRIGVTMRDLRCVMLNLDPDTAAADARVLRTTARLNAACAGVYGVPLRTGTLAVGDQLHPEP